DAIERLDRQREPGSAILTFAALRRQCRTYVSVCVWRRCIGIARPTPVTRRVDTKCQLVRIRVAAASADHDPGTSIQRNLERKWQRNTEQFRVHERMERLLPLMLLQEVRLTLERGLAAAACDLHA